MFKQMLAIAVLTFFILPGIGLAQVTAEAQLCTGISERMPTGMAETFPADIQQVYLWCKISGISGTSTIKHVWYYNGQEKAAVELTVNGPTWRTWSAKKILPAWTGDWSVKIIDAAGATLKELSFKIAAPGGQ